MAQTFSMSRSTLWDRIGIGVSGLCAVHCLLMPLALAALPLWPAAYALHEWLHPALAALLVPVTVLAMRNGLREGGGRPAATLLGVGLGLVLAAWLIHDAVGEPGEVAMTLSGSALLITGHWLNWRSGHRH